MGQWMANKYKLVHGTILLGEIIAPHHNMQCLRRSSSISTPKATLRTARVCSTCSKSAHRYNRYLELFWRLSKTVQIPDSIISDIVVEKLRSRECVTNGWVLHDFPLTDEQVSL